MRSLYKSVINSVYKPLAVGLACLALSGCPGKPTEAPKREDYNANAVGICPNKNLQYQFELIDENEDGNVDLITIQGRGRGQYIFIAPRYKTDRVPEAGAREMTPEEQEAANQALRTGNDFSYRIAKAKSDGSKKSD